MLSPSDASDTPDLKVATRKAALKCTNASPEHSNEILEGRRVQVPRGVCLGDDDLVLLVDEREANAKRRAIFAKVSSVGLPKPRSIRLMSACSTPERFASAG